MTNPAEHWAKWYNSVSELWEFEFEIKENNTSKTGVNEFLTSRYMKLKTTYKIKNKAI